MRSCSIFLVAVFVLAGCVNNQGLKPTYSAPPVPPIYPVVKPAAKPTLLASMSPKLFSMQRTLMASPLNVEPSVTYSPLDSSDFLTIRVEGTNFVLAWPTNAAMNGAIPVWKSNLVNGLWRPVPSVSMQTNKNWRTTNEAMFEFRAPIRPNETRFFALSTNFCVNIAWNYDTNEITSRGVTGFKIYTGPSSRNYNLVINYPWQTAWDGGTNFSAWVLGLPTTQHLYLAATAYLTNATEGELESEFSLELELEEQR